MNLLAQAADLIPPTEFWLDKGITVTMLGVCIWFIRFLYKAHGEEMERQRNLHDEQTKREQQRCDARHGEMCKVVTDTVETFDGNLKEERKLRESSQDVIRGLSTAVAKINGG